MTSEKNYLKAIRLINIEDRQCDFEVGKIPVRQHIKQFGMMELFYGKT
ncbi:hypothetical protein [Pedobacter punctiformis]|uniref:Uncharacterized protein n=1 Tax=Pedobacter punctiformis TaxID=3004097 RepID=A0ABT4L964_9SPHI|nr:hypothetical protein [Pedobacter sp. HCMS5-2]MCZ4244462.1 hypothetical protein [Pedobacter sp. HCMS5-2]